MGRDCLTLILLLILDVVSSYNVVRKDPFASLSETLVTRQRAACDGKPIRGQCLGHMICINQSKASFVAGSQS